MLLNDAYVYKLVQSHWVNLTQLYCLYLIDSVQLNPVLLISIITLCCLYLCIFEAHAYVFFLIALHKSFEFDCKNSGVHSNFDHANYSTTLYFSPVFLDIRIQKIKK
jgi:hypothetical protein